MAITDVAQTTGDHDRLVVTAHLVTVHTRCVNFQGTEVTAQVGATKFVIEGSSANRPFDHDIQRGGDTPGFTVGLLPGLTKTRDVQIGYGKTVQPGLGLGTTPGGAFVTDFTTGTGGRPRMRRNRRGVVMGFHLHQHMHRFIHELILLTARRGEKAIGHRTRHYRRVIAVSA